MAGSRSRRTAPKFKRPSEMERELRRQIRNFQKALQYQAETIRILAERLPVTKPIGRDNA